MKADTQLGSVLQAHIPGGGREFRFEPGQFLFHQGEPASSLHMVTEGRIAVRLLTEDGNTVTVAVCAAGDVLGELALIAANGARAASAVALEPVTTRVITKEEFDGARRQLPEVGDLLVELLADRLRSLNERLTEALYVAADVRALRRLRDMVDIYGTVVPLRQEDLADLAGTTRATVNRVLRRLERDGVVSLGRGRVRVVDQAALARAGGVRPPGR